MGPSGAIFSLVTGQCLSDRVYHRRRFYDRAQLGRLPDSGVTAGATGMGVIGTRHARFSDFVYRPATIKAFLKDTLRLRAKRYIGHNPAGGAMVILLMLSLLITAGSGMLLFGAAEQSGPLAQWFAQSGSAWADPLEEVHEFFANFTMLLVVIHVAGVIIESLIHRENLVSAMISGFKPAQDASSDMKAIEGEKQ